MARRGGDKAAEISGAGGAQACRGALGSRNAWKHGGISIIFYPDQELASSRQCVRSFSRERCQWGLAGQLLSRTCCSSFQPRLDPARALIPPLGSQDRQGFALRPVPAPGHLIWAAGACPTPNFNLVFEHWSFAGRTEEVLSCLGPISEPPLQYHLLVSPPWIA
jgi:hypothetical protein